EGQPLRDRVARLGLARPAHLLCSVGAELYLLADDDPPPAADARAHLDDGTLTAGRHEWPVAPQLLSLLAAICEAGPAGVTPEELYLAVWDAPDYHPLRHRNAVYVAVNRLRGALEPIAGKEAVRSSATHYTLAPTLRIALVRAIKRLPHDARASVAQARWQAALRAAESS
ncbi:MAG: transcriptional regulator, family, partial [Myxococcales bacterium]|nr:transcriptional regulator, family [Myxococcales bacterium]